MTSHSHDVAIWKALLFQIGDGSVTSFLLKAKVVTQEDQKFFIEDVKEDLDLLDESHAAGLGIDLAQ